MNHYKYQASVLSAYIIRQFEITKKKSKKRNKSEHNFEFSIKMPVSCYNMYARSGLLRSGGVSSSSSQFYGGSRGYGSSSYGDDCLESASPMAGLDSSYGSGHQNLSKFSDYSRYEHPEIDVLGLQLPPPNMDCYHEPPAPQSETKFCKYNPETVNKTVTQNFHTCKSVVKENNIHHDHVKNVCIKVNRNHFHTQRVVVKDNHFHHHLTNNIIKVNDIHHQKIEEVRGQGKLCRDYKQTQRICTPASCQNISGNDDECYDNSYEIQQEDC